MAYRAQDILDQLDDHARSFTFPMLDNGYVYLVDTRLTAWRDDERWAITIEVLGYSPRAGQLDNALHRYGNCMKGLPGTRNEEFICVLDGAIEDPDTPEHANPKLEVIRVRGNPTRVAVRNDQPEHLSSLFRRLAPEHRDALLATDEELGALLPSDLPLFLQLNTWRHPDCVVEERPSQTEAFRLLARAMEQGDPVVYSPTEPPNTHWSNWPEGGSL